MPPPGRKNDPLVGASEDDPRRWGPIDDLRRSGASDLTNAEMVRLEKLTKPTAPPTTTSSPPPEARPESPPLTSSDVFDFCFYFIVGAFDLAWSFFPIGIVVLVLALTPTGLGHLGERSDLLLAAAVVFIDGARKLHEVGDRRLLGSVSPPIITFPSIGWAGAIVSSILITFVLLGENTNVASLHETVAAPRFQQLQTWVLIAALIYGLRVRMVTMRDKELREKAEQELKTDA